MAVKKKKTKTLRVKKQTNTSVGTVFVHRILALLLLVVSVGGIVFFAVKGVQKAGQSLFSANPQFEIQEIHISTDGVLPERLLKQLAKVEIGDNLFELSAPQIEERLKLSPKIKSVAIERQMPGTLAIEVKERFALARISYKERDHYPKVIDSEGVVMEPIGNISGLPLIYGEPGLKEGGDVRPGATLSSPALQHSLDVIHLCNTTSWGRMIEIDSIDAGYQDFVKVYLKSKTLVYVPQTRPEVLEGKLRRLVVVLQAAGESGRTAKEIDLIADGINVPVKY
jgi:hypothetical protein